MAGEIIVVEETGLGPFQVEVHAGASTFLMDEPKSVGGGGTGPNPYDLLSASLGACTAMTIRLYARRKEWPLEKARVRVTHARPSLSAKDRFERDIELVGELSAEQRQRLLEIAMRCPVHLSLERGADIETRLAPEPIAACASTQGDHARDVAEACD